jgi:hypothetical protein
MEQLRLYLVVSLCLITSFPALLILNVERSALSFAKRAWPGA